MNRDSVQVHLSDTHCGGLTALYPNYPLTFEHDKNNSITISPTDEQRVIYEHFMYCADEAKRIAKKKRIQIVFNGDATEGSHHGNVEVVTPQMRHHVQIFKEVFDNFLARIGFSVKNGDTLDFIVGTHAHTEYEEYKISEMYSDFGAQYHYELKKEINGKQIRWVHQGANAGKGANIGNAHRNWLRDVYWEDVNNGIKPADLIVSSHFHKAHKGSYDNSYFHTVNGIILPSWQLKTKFGYRVSPFSRNDIGLNITEVTADGFLKIHKPLLMAMDKK